MRYARRMNGYSEVPHNGEINNYLRKDLDAKATAKNTACWNLLGKVRTKRTLCFSLYTALELCGVELPRHSTLPQKDFYVTVRSKGTRSSLDNVDYRIWNAKFNSIAFSNGVTCMHPMDAWIQFAQYLNLTELVVLAEALIRRYGYAIEQFTQRLTAFHRVIGRARCEAALKLVKPSDSVQETRTRLALMLFGLPIPQTQYGITDSENDTPTPLTWLIHNTKSLLNMMAIITVASANNMCGTSKNVDVCGNWAGPSSRCSPMTCGTPPNNVPSHKRLPPRCKYRFLAVLNLHAGY